MDAIEVRTATLRSGILLPCAETGRPGSSLPVLLLHAFVESYRYFEPVLRSLPPSIHAVAPTQRGHTSVEGNPASYRIEDLASDVVDLMDSIGIDQAMLIGASSGGLVAQVVARQRPQRVAGSVLISSPVTLVDEPGVIAMRDEIMEVPADVVASIVPRAAAGRRTASPDEHPRPDAGAVWKSRRPRRRWCAGAA